MFVTDDGMLCPGNFSEFEYKCRPTPAYDERRCLPLFAMFNPTVDVGAEPATTATDATYDAAATAVNAADVNCVCVLVCVAGAPGVGDDDAARMDTGNSERASHSQ